MSLARGKFGIEYDPRHIDNKSSGPGWLFAVIAIVALASFAWALVARYRSRGNPSGAVEAPSVVQTAIDQPATEPKPSGKPEGELVTVSALSRRPVAVRNLLMRLEEAERRRDIEMSAATIYELRALPGNPAADIDDALARRLGALNMRRLFERHNAQWVKKITVKRGDSASRLAAENGSTLASLAKLNGVDVERIVIGKDLFVMDHPRFNLVVHRRTRLADLSLNGRFFKRYDLLEDVSGRAGAYEFVEPKRRFLKRIGVVMRDDDVAELETLLPIGTPLLISEM